MKGLEQKHLPQHLNLPYEDNKYITQIPVTTDCPKSNYV